MLPPVLLDSMRRSSRLSLTPRKVYTEETVDGETAKELEEGKTERRDG
jgi:hypothetical protein